MLFGPLNLHLLSFPSAGSTFSSSKISSFPLWSKNLCVTKYLQQKYSLSCTTMCCYSYCMYIYNHNRWFLTHVSTWAAGYLRVFTQRNEFRFFCSVLTWLVLSVQCQYKKSENSLRYRKTWRLPPQVETCDVKKYLLLLLLYLLYLYAIIIIKTMLCKITSRCVTFEYIVRNYIIGKYWLSSPPMSGDYFYTCPTKSNLSSLSNYLCSCITWIRWGFRFNFFTALWVPIYDASLLGYSSDDCTEHWLTTFKFF